MMAEQKYASIEDMAEWAEGIIATRPPDFKINNDYLNRWHVLPRNPWMNLYVHEMTGPDDDRGLHDHPWPNMSLLLKGGYREHRQDGTHDFSAGAIINREATDLHRLELPVGVDRCISLFWTGEKVREWGFLLEDGSWINWMRFIKMTEAGTI